MPIAKKKNASKSPDSSNAGSELPENVRRTVLPNGVVVLSEWMSGQRSASVGVWLGLGSRHDPVGKAGLAHLYEHMVFKGTAKRSSARISRELEEVGGHLNAFTSREQTCFYAKVLDRDQDRAATLVCDLVTGAKLSAKELELERGVVLEEIRGCEDDPEELVGDLFAEALWAKQPLGAPIAGTLDSVAAITGEDLRRHLERSLSPEIPMLVAAAGNVDHDSLVACAGEALQAKACTSDAVQKIPRVGGRIRSRLVVRKDVTQVNLILSRRSLGAHAPQRHALGLVNLVLGGGMASRLNQEIREKRGLAYSVYSFADFLLGAGALGVSLGTEPAQAAKAMEVVSREIAKIRQNGLSKRDLRFAKDYASGSAVLALESPGSRMQNLGKCQFLYGRPLGLDEILATIEAVTPDQIAEAIEEHLPLVSADAGWTLAAVVPEDFKEELLP
ncbi:MAG TPA: pitrilysin family protein [Fibrobacteria bacterium]|nr:pitrilysin family protein [Fibrobacteria bacterium]